MKNYFMISEFAKLRGININSLRYYEKLGLLKPAYIDDKTGYRYYSAEQVSVLNKIIMCINLGIPLKEMTEYLDEDGNLQSQKILERGRVEAQKRMEELQNNLKFIDISLKGIEDYKEYAGRKGCYFREIEERNVIVTRYYDDMPEVKEMISEVGEIYKIAQEREMFPILPAGQIWEIDDTGKVRIRFYLEVINCKQDVDGITTLPRGTYSCLQVDLEPNVDLMSVIGRNWGTDGAKTIIIDNVMLEKYSFETRSSELQKIEW